MDAVRQGADVLFILLGAIMVLAMHSGFAFLELGTVREKNQVNALVKILTDFAASTLAYFFVGYGIVDRAQGIDDYAGVDVNNCIVLFLRGKPDYYKHPMSHGDKVRIARERGAIGYLTATGPISHDPQFQEDLKHEEQDAQDFAENIKFYPVISFGICYQFW